MITRVTAATPACLLGMLLRMAYKAKKYHSGTMCAGVVSGLAWIELSGVAEGDWGSESNQAYTDGPHDSAHKVLYE